VEEENEDFRIVTEDVLEERKREVWLKVDIESSVTVLAVARMISSLKAVRLAKLVPYMLVVLVYSCSIALSAAICDSQTLLSLMSSSDSMTLPRGIIRYSNVDSSIIHREETDISIKY